MSRTLRNIAAVALIAALGSICVSTASAARRLDRCGGGSNLNQLIAGWKAHGVLNDVAKTGGFNPSLDGNPVTFITNRMVIVRTQRAVRVVNDGCAHNGFHKADVNTVPKGTLMAAFLPAQYTKGDVSTSKCAGCTKVTFSVTKAFKISCGNKNIIIVVTFTFVIYVHHGASSTTKPCGCSSSTPAAVCSGDNTAVQTGTGNVNGNCNKVNNTCTGYNSCSPTSTCTATNSCNSVSNICTGANSCGTSPGCTINCTPGCTINCGGTCTINCTPTVVCQTGYTLDTATNTCAKDGTIQPGNTTSGSPATPGPSGGTGGSPQQSTCFSSVDGSAVPATDPNAVCS